ncbi:MAG: tetratricopeptide repeat protein [Planctomycetes bacterium]|nr:tetratricopeptide repeat protein [Planctomycetota bacterium]
MARRIDILPVLIPCLLGTGAAWGQESGPGGSPPGWIGEVADIEALDRAVAPARAAGDWGQVVRGYQEALERAPTVLASEDGRLFVPLREICRRRIEALGPEALGKYRDLYDSLARALLAEGIEKRDPALLSRVAREYPCSSVAGEALERAGLLLLDRGSFAAGARALRASGRPGVEEALARVDLLLHREKMEESSPTANLLAPTVSPVWRISLSGLADQERYQRVFRGRTSELGLPFPRPIPAVVPFVYRDRAIFQVDDGRRLVFVGLVNETTASSDCEEWDQGRLDSLDRTDRFPFDRGFLLAWRIHGQYSAHSLSASGDRVFAVEGDHPLPYLELLSRRDRSDRALLAEHNRIAVRDLAHGGMLVATLGGHDASVRWVDGARFLAAPQTGQGLLLAPVQAGRDYHLYAFREDDLSFRWSTHLCSQENWRGGESLAEVPRQGSFLAVQADRAYWASDDGVVIAVDLSSGARAWIALSRDLPVEVRPEDRPAPEDLHPSPLVLAGSSIVFCHPPSQYVYCLDADTGRERWRHWCGIRELLLGESRGLVFVAGRGVTALSLGTGEVVWRTWDPVAVGRGVFAGDSLYLPGRLRGQEDAIFRIELATGRTLARTSTDREIELGNLVFTGRMILSAGPREVVALPTAALLAKKIAQIERRIEANPGDARALFERSELLLSRGDYDNALADLARAVEAAHPATDETDAAQRVGVFADFTWRAPATIEERLQLHLDLASALLDADRIEETLAIYDLVGEFYALRRYDLPNGKKIDLAEYLSWRSRILRKLLGKEE